jgi:hypothetical protein
VEDAPQPIFRRLEGHPLANEFTHSSMRNISYKLYQSGSNGVEPEAAEAQVAAAIFFGVDAIAGKDML